MPGGLATRFQEFQISEIIPKIARAIREQKKIKIWKKEEGVASSFLLSLDGNQLIFEKFPDFIKDEDEFLFSFSLDEMTYLCKGYVLDLVDGLCNVSGKVYRTEKRSKERLLTYPTHRIFISFFIKNQADGGNVLSFQGHKNSELKFLKDFDSENPTPMQFRVVDLSMEGMSIFANKFEAPFFEERIGNYVDVLNLLSFENREIQLEGLKVIYSVDYMNPRAKDASMKKIGLQFVKNEFITDFLQDKIDSGEYLVETEEQFELFLNDLGE
ncbi:hypothetical protein M899_3319 [Bacteriovorax sp. BSW11_IV]|uniref:hypothetical protein n=1 Tax=Bacteriovorax sp. BSW11_IV TaxID=1353529 RepID=UPI00038A12A2|nr:hypothetical protein [Bacteriovorax sp. BSW11_IV]EQC48773.1 hypothetical protein M899_3319 [Bacteriovorax sp. BSW11_IV]